MGKAEIGLVKDIVSNKNKFRRAMIIIITLCVTAIIITGTAFYTGAITWHGGKSKIEARH